MKLSVFKLFSSLAILIILTALNYASNTNVIEEAYAELHIFRPKQYQGGAIVFTVLADNKPIATLKNGSKLIYRVYNEGSIDLQLKASVFTSKNVNFGVVKGKKYFIKAAYGDGFGSNLSFVLMDETEGKALLDNKFNFVSKKSKLVKDDSTNSVVKDLDYFLSRTLNFEEQKADKPDLAWLNPEKPYEKTDISKYSLQVCLSSEAEVANLSLYLNEKEIDHLNDIKLIDKKCAYNYIRNVDLGEGENTIKIILSDANGSSTFLRKIIYKPKKKSYRGLALLIGNSKYLHTTNLENTINDATAMSEALDALGFEVILAKDLSKEEMKKTLGFYLEKLRDYNTGIFFYAGHGIQYDGKNYMIPIDAKLEANKEIETNCFDTGRLLANMSLMELNTSVMILDACRNNPFKNIGHEVSDINSGLTGTDAPAGSLVAFATAPGKTASDGNDKNGLYTQEILNTIYKQDLKVEELFKRVRVSVMSKSKNRQIPWETSSLINDFYFNPATM
ncbi:hypothetical protein GCM10027429_20250 [Marivirga atlantica]|jgi:hypothetical protein|uniref:Caspase family protein n=1 Tax=Marivirga atlantica TaxID=1548457 RepID=A0A937ALA6_9BACT|nr:caspase family protein [Marivirga atlantica]MBL0765643.1 caspase family protein [Marivirga atlantica]